MPSPEIPGFSKPVTDTHAHLDHVGQRLGMPSLEGVLKVYQDSWDAAGKGEAGVRTRAFIVDIGTRPGDLSARLERFGAYPFLRFSAGLWPGNDSFADPHSSLALLEEDLARPECSALGECGLDYYHMEAEREKQISLFEAQATLAEDRGLPLIVHSRQAFEDTFGVVSALAGRSPVIIHCFGYGPGEAEAFLRAGCLLSFAGNISYKGGGPLLESLMLAGAERILLETDAPYMNPVPNKGKASTPLDIERTLHAAARALGLDAAVLEEKLQRRAQAIFSPGR